MAETSREHGVGVNSGTADLSEPVVSVRGLIKRYGRREAVRGIDFEVHHGEIFAFLGPNGAGKTTTVEILEGFRERTDGDVTVLGVDPAEASGAWRDRVGVVLQESEPEPGLSVRECLRLFAGYDSAPRGIDETIALVGLAAQTEHAPASSRAVSAVDSMWHWRSSATPTSSSSMSPRPGSIHQRAAWPGK